MKRDNKKALYESIMNAVAKEVKKTLNESVEDEKMLNEKLDNWTEEDFKSVGDKVGTILARNNLEVYSKNEIDKVISQIIESNKNFTTKKEVESMIAEIDVVNSTVKSYADYQIPNNLFQL